MDPAVTKGTGLDVGQIVVPTGASVSKSPGWLVNEASVAKYVNKTAPSGPTQAKVTVIKPAKLLKLVAKRLGDVPLDVFAGGDPGAGGVQTAYCVTNAAEESCHGSDFAACTHGPIAGGTGAKLVCKTGTPDPTCSAAPSP